MWEAASCNGLLSTLHDAAVSAAAAAAAALGSFALHQDGEADVRGTYTAVAVASITNVAGVRVRHGWQLSLLFAVDVRTVIGSLWLRRRRWRLLWLFRVTCSRGQQNGC